MTTPQSSTMPAVKSIIDVTATGRAGTMAPDRTTR